MLRQYHAMQVFLDSGLSSLKEVDLLEGDELPTPSPDPKKKEEDILLGMEN